MRSDTLPFSSFLANEKDFARFQVFFFCRNCPWILFSSLSKPYRSFFSKFFFQVLLSTERRRSRGGAVLPASSHLTAAVLAFSCPVPHPPHIPLSPSCRPSGSAVSPASPSCRPVLLPPPLPVPHLPQKRRRGTGRGGAAVADSAASGGGDACEGSSGIRGWWGERRCSWRHGGVTGRGGATAAVVGGTSVAASLSPHASVLKQPKSRSSKR